uniref:Purple acid phosphatase n=1 Tax=Quercus lobata TaxID=97700 RepID=A0A7N2L7F0_QUELO
MATKAQCLHLTAAMLCISLVLPSFADLQRFEHPAKADGRLSFLVVGDWGRRGFYNQSEVALQMGRIGEKLDIDFVISTGDNFYDDGLEGVNDPAFEESFSKIYTAKSLQKQWYSVLGNHDYRGNVEAQLSPVLQKIDSRWLCQRSFILNTEIAEFFFVDTTPFVNDYYKETYHKYDWRGVSPRRTYITNLLKDLESALRKSTAKRKIAANNVELYINGHDHCLERISTPDSPIQFLTSGAGSKAWRGDVNVKRLNSDDVKFFYDGQGFMSVQLTKAEAVVVFYDVFGKELHKWEVFKQLYSAM